MFDYIAPGVYQNRRGEFCIIADRVKNPKSLCHKIGLDHHITSDETVVLLNSETVESFLGIELGQRLYINFEGLGYETNGVSIRRFSGKYYIAAEPITPDELSSSGILDKVGPKQIVVKFNRFYRNGVAQNEINGSFCNYLRREKVFYSSLLARQFCNILLGETET